MYILDLHCDTLHKFYENPAYSFHSNNGHITASSLRLGGYMAQCFAVFLPPEIKRNEQYTFFRNQYNRYLQISGGLIRTAKTKRDILCNLKKGKTSSILTVENADFLNGDFKKLKIIEHLGVKFLGLCWNEENCIAFPNSTNPQRAALPLKQFGRELIYRLNFSPVIADVSHLNSGGVKNVAAISKVPFIASHSACRAVFDHPRNLTDNEIRLIGNSGGVVGLNFYSRFLNGTNKTELSDIIRHFRHLIKVGGESVAAIGTDFDGMDCSLPIKTAADMPYLADILIKEFGFSVAEKICYKNALRLF